MIKLYIVIPCYNEEEILVDTTQKITNKLNSLISNDVVSSDSRIIYVDDGSKDNTWNIIRELHKNNIFVNALKLSKNRGHQNALLAGLMTVKDECDCIISMDADLQDDIDAIDEMIEQFNNGSDIVYGVRNDRKSDTFFKRNSAQMYYKLMSRIGVEIVYNHADYRLMSQRALNALEDYKEFNLFLRGVVPDLGFKTSIVEYSRKERLAGESKYTLKKMIHLAFDGITSFSVKPIRMITFVGFLMFVVSIGFLIYSFIRHINGNTVSGWTSLIWSIWSIGALQMISIGIIGEYLSKVYLETKRRPRYIIEEKLDDK